MKRLLLLFATFLFLCSCQQELTTGNVYGTVTDYETGETIKNASVSLTPSRHKSVVTGSDGYYEFNDLISTNLDNTYRKWKYEVVDGYARPVFE